MKISSLKNSKVLRSWQLYLMLLLPLVYIIIFSYVPMYGTQLAFRKYSPTAGISGGEWRGLDYFIRFFSSYQFGRVLTNTLLISAYSLVAGFPVPIILALALNAVRSQVYKKTVQLITYLPHFISTVVMAGIIIQVFNTRIGLYGRVFDLFGGTAPDVLGAPGAFSHLYVWTGIWQSMGWGTIIYLAALSNVPQELHEAAMIDGATRFQRLIHIDIQAVIPTAVILFIMNAGQLMSVGFEKAYLLQNSLNVRASELISTYVYKTGLTGSGGGDFSYATAIGLFNSVINLILLVGVNYIAKTFGETSLW